MMPRRPSSRRAASSRSRGSPGSPSTPPNRGASGSPRRCSPRPGSNRGAASRVRWSRSRSEPRRCGRRWPAGSRPPKGDRWPTLGERSRRAPRWAGYRMRSRSPSRCRPSSPASARGPVRSSRRGRCCSSWPTSPARSCASPGQAMPAAPAPGHAGAVRHRCPGRSFPHRARGRSRSPHAAARVLVPRRHPLARRGARHPGRRGVAGRTDVARRPGARRSGGTVGGLRLDVRPPRGR